MFDAVGLLTWSINFSAIGIHHIMTLLHINRSQLFCQFVLSYSQDVLRGSREHPFKYYNTMNVGLEMHCYECKQGNALQIVQHKLLLTL